MAVVPITRRVVSAAGSAAGTGTVGSGVSSAAVEAAMAAAVTRCLEDGITDPDTIRRAQIAAATAARAQSVSYTHLTLPTTPYV